MGLIKIFTQMKNIINKGSKTVILLLLGCLIASCNSMDHDLEFNELNDEIAHLKNVDDAISEEITKELLKLESELMVEISKAEEFISEKLSEKITEIDDKIKDQANSLNGTITDHSNQIGIQITNWDTEIGQLITSRSESLETARGVMQRAHETAIAENNTELQNRIRAGEQHLNSFENMLPNLAESTSSRIAVVMTIQERYNSVIDSLESLETQREILESTLATFKSTMESVINNKLQEHATSDEMNDFFEEISDIYDEASEIIQEMEGIYSELETIESNLPDVDSWISNLDHYFNQIDNALDLLSDFESYDFEGVLDKCDEVFNQADEMGSRIESAAEETLSLASILNGLLDGVMGIVEDRISELQEYASDLDTISADVEALLGDF